MILYKDITVFPFYSLKHHKRDPWEHWLVSPCKMTHTGLWSSSLHLHHEARKSTFLWIIIVAIVICLGWAGPGDCSHQLRPSCQLCSVPSGPVHSPAHLSLPWVASQRGAPLAWYPGCSWGHCSSRQCHMGPYSPGTIHGGGMKKWMSEWTCPSEWEVRYRRPVMHCAQSFMLNFLNDTAHLASLASQGWWLALAKGDLKLKLMNSLAYRFTIQRGFGLTKT